MIKGVHAMFYTDDPAATRAFLRDKMQLDHFDSDGKGWLIFRLSEVDMGVHPTEGSPAAGTHDISFYCDDLDAEVAAMQSRGVSFDGEIENQGWGKVIGLRIPGGIRVQLYQPLYNK